MKMIDRVIISIVRIWNRKWIAAINIVLGVFAIGLMGTTIHMYNEASYREKEISRITEVDSEKLLYVYIANMNFEDKSLKNRILQFVKDIKSVNSADWAGTFIVGETTLKESVDGLNDIYMRYSEKGEVSMLSSAILDMSKKFKYNKTINTLSINASALQATGIELPIELEALKETEEYIPVLVGSELSKIMKVGSVYTLLSEKTIKVVGVLEKGSNYYCSSISEGAKPIISLDGYVVFPETYEYGEFNASACRDSILVYMNNEKVYEELYHMANKYRLSIEISNIEELLDKQLKENEDNKDMLMLMVVILFLTSVAYVTAGIVSVLTEKQELGIYYSCGFTHKDIAIILLIENIIKILISVIIGIFIVYKDVVNNRISANYIELSKDVFFRYDVTFIVPIVLLILIVVTVIPIKILNRISVSSMVRENS